jgi:hypothetical protein
VTDRYLLDNTVLCNFASVHRLDLLRRFLDGRGSWVEAVAYEAACSVRYLSDLAGVHSDGWLGDPIEFEDADDIQRIEQIRRGVFGGRDTVPTRHLGEAQTFYVLKHRPNLAGAIWLTDDAEAIRVARLQQFIVRDTPELLELAVRDEVVAASETDALLIAMADAGRGVRLT